MYVRKIKITKIIFALYFTHVMISQDSGCIAFVWRLVNETNRGWGPLVHMDDEIGQTFIVKTGLN